MTQLEQNTTKHSELEEIVGLAESAEAKIKILAPLVSADFGMPKKVQTLI